MGYLPWALFAMVTYGIVAVLLKLAFRGINPAFPLVVTNGVLVLAGLGWMAALGSGVTAGPGARGAQGGGGGRQGASS